MKLIELCQWLNTIAPAFLQEDYDNSGLLTGNYQTDVTGILVSLDVTEDIVKEAVLNNCNVIVAHHPIIFKGLKSITGKNYVERTLVAAIKNDIAIVAVHTNLDNIWNGVNFKIAEKLQLQNVRILKPKSNILKKLVVFVPVNDTEKLAQALHQAGAGNIGNYKDCSFRVEGVGTFRPNEQANPHIGEKNKLEYVQENRLEVIFPAYAEHQVLKAMYANHPYEEVAYYLTGLDNALADAGSGAIGELAIEMRTDYFFEKVKAMFKSKVIRHSKMVKDSVKKVAVCGGAGFFLLKDAIASQADVFLTADVKYHDFFDADGKIILADMGHYESEQFTKDLLFDIISKKFTNIAVLLSKVNTNPIFYL